MVYFYKPKPEGTPRASFIKYKCMKTFLIIATGVMLTLPVFGQTPVATTAAFQKKFPTAKSVQWEQDADGTYEADFKVNGKKMSAAFSAAGIWLETETDIKIKALPEAVRAAIANAFSGYEIQEAERVETPEGVVYEVKMEKEADGQETELEVLFAGDGKLLKQEVEEDDDEAGEG